MRQVASGINPIHRYNWICGKTAFWRCWIVFGVQVFVNAWSLIVGGIDSRHFRFDDVKRVESALQTLFLATFCLNLSWWLRLCHTNRIMPALVWRLIMIISITRTFIWVSNQNCCVTITNRLIKRIIFACKFDFLSFIPGEDLSDYSVRLGWQRLPTHQWLIKLIDDLLDSCIFHILLRLVLLEAISVAVEQRVAIL